MSPQDRGPGLTDSILLAILSLIAEKRDGGPAERSQPKIEMVLTNAGLDVETIGRVLNKQPEAVRKAISRAKARAIADTSQVSGD